MKINRILIELIPAANESAVMPAKRELIFETNKIGIKSWLGDSDSGLGLRLTEVEFCSELGKVIEKYNGRI